MMRPSITNKNRATYVLYHRTEHPAAQAESNNPIMHCCCVACIYSLAAPGSTLSFLFPQARLLFLRLNDPDTTWETLCGDQRNNHKVDSFPPLRLLSVLRLSTDTEPLIGYSLIRWVLLTYRLLLFTVFLLHFLAYQTQLQHLLRLDRDSNHLY